MHEDVLAATFKEENITPIAQEQLAQVKIWLAEGELLDGLRELLGDAGINHRELEELLALGQTKLRIGNTDVDAPVCFAELVRQREELPEKLIKDLSAHLVAIRGSGYGQEVFDPFVLATTKACPTCSMRSTHYHGHQCHMISPGKGCPSCKVK